MRLSINNLSNLAMTSSVFSRMVGSLYDRNLSLTSTAINSLLPAVLFGTSKVILKNSENFKPSHIGSIEALKFGSDIILGAGLIAYEVFQIKSGIEAMSNSTENSSYGYEVANTLSSIAIAMLWTKISHNTCTTFNSLRNRIR